MVRLNTHATRTPQDGILEALKAVLPDVWKDGDTVLELSSFYNDRKDQGMHACQCGVELPAASLREILTRIREDLSGPGAGFGILGDDGEWEASFGKDCGTAFLTWHERGTDRCLGFEISPTDEDFERRRLAELFRKPFRDRLETPDGMNVTLQGHSRSVLAIRPAPGDGFAVTVTDGQATRDIHTADLGVKDICALTEAVIHYCFTH